MSSWIWSLGQKGQRVWDHSIGICRSRDTICLRLLKWKKHLKLIRGISKYDIKTNHPQYGIWALALPHCVSLGHHLTINVWFAWALLNWQSKTRHGPVLLKKKKAQAWRARRPRAHAAQSSEHVISPALGKRNLLCPSEGRQPWRVALLEKPVLQLARMTNPMFEGYRAERDEAARGRTMNNTAEARIQANKLDQKKKRPPF